MGHTRIIAPGKSPFTFFQGDDADEWTLTLRDTFGPMWFRPLGTERGSFSLRRVDGGYLADVRTAPAELGPDRRHADGHGRHGWKLQYVIQGDVGIEQNGRAVQLRPGEMGLYDTDRAYRLHVTGRGRVIVVRIPKSALPLPPDAAALLAPRRLDPAPGVTSALAGLLRSLAIDLTVFGEESLASVNWAVIGLLSAVVREALDEAAGLSVVRRNAETVAAVRQFILRNIANPALDPTLIAQTFHISVRQLHRLFEEQEGTVSQEIRAQRIQRCAEDLRNPGRRHEKVSDIAARWGIPDPSKFSRQFRDAYGVSPRSYRADATRG